MCDFIARTHWLNTKSNYFMHTIIIFNLSYYTSITITLTFVNQAMLCCASFFFSPENYPHKSGAIFHIDLNVLIFTWKFLMAPTSFTVWSGWPSFKTNLLEFHTAEWIIFAVTGISVCSPLSKTPFTTVVLDGFLSSMKVSSSTNWSPFPSFFFWLGVTNNAAKPNCVVWTGDDGSLNDGHSWLVFILCGTVCPKSCRILCST